jgi:hypothetical protein
MRLSVTNRGTVSRAKAATGRLTKKIHRQEARSVSTPEITVPDVPPIPAMPPQIPSAFIRSRGSGNNKAIRPSEAGAARASPAPWTNREATSMVGSMAAPQVADAAANRATPSRNSFRRPRMSAIRPPSRSSPPAVST